MIRGMESADRWLSRFLCLHVALIPISIAAGQIWAYFASVLFLLMALRQAPPPGGYPLMRWVAFYGAAIALSILFGVRPLYSLAKADRFLLFAVPLAMGALAARRPVDSNEQFLERLVTLFLAGCSIKALIDCFRIPIQYIWMRREAIDASAPYPGLFDLGNMRDPQFYAVAICLLLALVLHRTRGFSRRVVFPALLVNALALLLHFKRGAWFATAAGVLLVALLCGRRKAVFWIVLSVLVAAQIPAVKERISLLRDEFRVGAGGRYALWTEVAPELFREYPWGMGWRSVRHADLQQNPAAVVQPKLNHLHNNLLQIRLETGWAGVGTWLLLMGSALAYAVRGWRRASSRWRGPALGILAALLTLHLNGLVEYNAGDAEIFMLMNLLIGLAVAGSLVVGRPPPADESTPAMPHGC